MREILFRGKLEYWGDWVEGYYVHIPIGRNGKPDHLIQAVHEDGRIGFLHNVIPETVGQYTGLKDKNGKRIFEGDIVKHDFGEDQIGVQYAAVEYSDKHAAFMIKPLHDWMLCGKSDCEVIGNIHDNPELLEDT